MADSSDSPLSEHSDNEFGNTPQRGTKRGVSADSPTSQRPAKKIMLKYRSTPDARQVQAEYYLNPPNNIHGLVPARNAPQYAQSPTLLGNSSVQTSPQNQMSFGPTLELTQLRENNDFLRRHNVQLAKAQVKANQQVQNAKDEVTKAKQESAEARAEIERLKRENQILTDMTQQGSGFDAAGMAKRMAQLEEYRRVYFECGVEWARREQQWIVERDLLRSEVKGLMERIEVLEGEAEEERAKVRAIEGERLERERVLMLGSVGGGGEMGGQGHGHMGFGGMGYGQDWGPALMYAQRQQQQQQQQQSGYLSRGMSMTPQGYHISQTRMGNGQEQEGAGFRQARPQEEGQQQGQRTMTMQEQFQRHQAGAHEMQLSQGDSNGNYQEGDRAIAGTSVDGEGQGGHPDDSQIAYGALAGQPWDMDLGELMQDFDFSAMGTQDWGNLTSDVFPPDHGDGGAEAVDGSG
jgi:hypothetical protein